MNPQQPYPPRSRRFHKRAARWAACASIFTVTAGTALCEGPLAAAKQADSTSKVTFSSEQQVLHPLGAGVTIIDVDKSANGKAIGADTLICIGATPRCTATFDLAGGDVFALTSMTKGGATGTIVGGSGRYARATGTVLARDVTGKKTTVILTVDRS